MDWNKLAGFKVTLLRALKLVRSEVALLGNLQIPERKVAFQIPEEAVPLLKHCTGWNKDWLFSLDVRGVQLKGEAVIPVKEAKVAQLKLQEDPGKWPKDLDFNSLMLS